VLSLYILPVVQNSGSIKGEDCKAMNYRRYCRLLPAYFVFCSLTCFHCLLCCLGMSCTDSHTL